MKISILPDERPPMETLEKGNGGYNVTSLERPEGLLLHPYASV